MAFQTALSGLNAAQTNLSVTGNNIANSSTNGFKKSRAEFADIYATSFAGASSTAVGSGVKVANIGQQFTQGNVEFTENSLDLAINGEGFFVLENTDGSVEYSRAGAYGVDREGYVVNSQGQKLQMYEVNDIGEVTSFTPTDMQLNTGANPASPTDLVDMNLNLDASADGIFGPMNTSDPASYNFSTSTTIYDSLGESHTQTLYFQRQAGATVDIDIGSLDLAANAAVGDTYQGQDTQFTIADSEGNTYEARFTFQNTADGPPEVWEATLEVDDGTGGGYAAVGTPATITFDGGGPNGGPTVTGADFGGAFGPFDPAADPFNITADFSSLTQNLNGYQVGNITTGDGLVPTWNVMMTIDGQVFDTETLTFNSDGSLATTPADINFNDGDGTIDNSFDPGNGADPMQLTVDFDSSTQYAGDSTVNSLVQNGYTTGRLSSIEIDDSGVVFARFTNGQSETLGAVALVTFSNPQGLQPVGDSNWIQTFESGDVLPGQAGSGTLGTIQSGALEASNVDLSKQLVNMIVAQRDFQANAKMISTEDQVTQSIINIR